MCISYRKAPLCKGRLWYSAKPQIAQHTERSIEVRPYQFDILEFGGESPLTIRARCSAFRYCPDPLGIVTAEVSDKLEFTKLFHQIL